MWPEIFLLLFVFFTIAHLTGEEFKNARVCYLTNAFGKFVREIPNKRFYTMITYLAGQLCRSWDTCFFRTPYSLIFIYPAISEMPSVIRGPIRKRGSPM